MDITMLNLLRRLVPITVFGTAFKDFILLLIVGELLIYVLNAKKKHMKINLFGKAKNDN